MPNLENDTYEIWGDYQQELVNMYIPLNTDPKINDKFDKCHVKSYFNDTLVELLANSSNYTLTTCSEYVYSKQYYQNTLVTEVIFYVENRI